MKAILLLSPFSLQGTYVHNDLQIKKNKDPLKNLRKPVCPDFFIEKRLNKYIELKNNLSKSDNLYFVINDETGCKEFYNYLINLTKAIHRSQIKMIVLDYITCNCVKDPFNMQMVKIIESIFSDNEFPVVYLKKGKQNKKMLEFSCISPNSVDREFIDATHKHVKKVFDFKNQITTVSNTQHHLSIKETNQNEFLKHSHTYNLN